MNALFEAYLICSLEMSIIAAFFLVLSPLLSRRYKAKGQYYAWLIMIIGFIIPFRPQITVLKESAVLPSQMPSGISQSLEYLYISSVETIQTVQISEPLLAHRITGSQILMAIWVIGVVWIIAGSVVKYCRFKNALKRWSYEVTTYGKVKVLASPMIESPMLIGIIHPLILLPNRKYTKDELGFIIKHEMIHYHRKDLWYKCVLLTAKALHWFNPILYFVSHAVAVLCELSCDEAVMSNVDSHERKRYSQAILSSHAYQAGIQNELITYFTGGKKLMYERIKAILNGNSKRPSFIIFLLAALLTVSAGVVLAGTSAEDKTKTVVSEWNLPSSRIFSKYPGVPLITPQTKAEIAYYDQFDIRYDSEKSGYCYKGELVGLFLDRCRNGEGIIYLSDHGEVNIKIERDNHGKITEVKTLSDDADYEIEVYMKELDEYFSESDFHEWNLPDSNISSRYPGVPLITPSSDEEIAYYEQFDILYDSERNGFCYDGKLVGLFIDRCRNGQGVIFLSDKGEVNIKINRSIRSGEVTKVETLSDDVDLEIDVYFAELDMLH